MIKKIQLRGISREPSDRMNSDGGVAESINTYINDGESVPMLPPKDVTEELGLPSQEEEQDGQWIMRSRAVYIHRVGTKDNFIYIKKAKPKTGQYGVSYDYLYSYPDGQEIWVGSRGEAIRDATVTSIGNTLIFATNKRNGYALYKDGSYTYLGSEIPKPAIDVYPRLMTDAGANFSPVVTLYESSVRPLESSDDNIKTNASIYEAEYPYWKLQMALEEGKRDELIKSITEQMWSGVQESLLNSKYFKYPVFVRFAIRLYDSSVVSHTVPIYLGAGSNRLIRASLEYSAIKVKVTGGATGSTVASLKYTSKIQLEKDTDSYQIFSKLNNAADYDAWKDVIQSIDMFISVPVIYPEVNSDIVAVSSPTHETISETEFRHTLPLHLRDAYDSADEDNGIRDTLLDATRNFYKVKSFSIDNLTELSEGYLQTNSTELSYKENLFTRELMPYDYRTNNTYVGEQSYTYNRRLLTIGVKEIFGSGMESLYGLVPTTAITDSNPETPLNYDFIYEIKDSDGSTKYVAGYDTLTTKVLEKYSAGYGRLPVGATSASVPKYNSDVAQLLFYPDSRCSAIYVINGNGEAVRLETKSHPYIDCAYYMGDLSKTLADFEYGVIDIPPVDNVGSFYKYSYLFQSASENPFYYPAAGRIKFSANIISVAAISAALSEGQYGQFDLYAFTDTGIWVLTPNDEGEFLRLNPLSRDVLLSSSAIVCIDQAVVFVTAKGVMLLSGAKISCISPNMIGKHYSMEQGAIDILSSHGFSGYETQLADSAPFMDFMQKVQIAYDYAGQRLIFFNTSKDYKYVYMLPTGTWHKSVLSARVLEATVLNSYPNCYLFYKGDSADLHMLNWSTILDVADDTTVVRSVIATRAIDLGEPDVFKTINHLRIRGQYERYASYVYLVSDSDTAPEVIEDNLREVIGNTPLTEDNIHHLATGGRYNVDEPFADGTTWRDRISGINDSLVAIDYAYLHLEVINEPRVSYILQGSNDGINYYVLHSLRGRSWKNYRIIVASRLKPTERISYVEIDYETRKTNKIR